MPGTPEKQELDQLVGNPCGNSSAGHALMATTIEVKAASYGTSTGIYLEKGDKLTISATGSWTVWKDVTDPFGPEGHPSLTPLNGCPKGALVAHIGLAYGATPYCIGKRKTITAETDGIVYLAMNDNASPVYHDGSVQVTLGTAELFAPTVDLSDVGDYPFCKVSSGWVELESQFVRLTVPAPLAAGERASVPEALRFLDRAYDAMRELASGEVPYGGDKVRFYPDFAIRHLGWILAGNPVRYDPKNLNGVKDGESKILKLGDPTVPSFEFLRSLGVGFSRIRGNRYQTGTAAAQAWAGVFALKAQEVLDREGDLPRALCADQEEHEATGSLTAFDQDPWLQLCLWQNVKEQFGWEILTGFFASLPASGAWDDELATDASAQEIWSWVAERLLAASSTADERARLRELLTAFKLP